MISPQTLRDRQEDKDLKTIQELRKANKQLQHEIQELKQNPPTLQRLRT